jgi:hypothetical protein
VLQVVAMAFVDLAIDGLLDPDNLVNQPIPLNLRHLLIAVSLEKMDCESVLVVDDPDKEEAVFLKIIEGQLVHDFVILKGIIGDGDTTRWVRRRKLPGWIHRNHIEHPTCVFLLSLNQVLKFELGHIHR